MSSRRTASVGRTSGVGARSSSVGRGSAKPTSTLTPLDGKPASKVPLRGVGSTPASRFAASSGGGKGTGIKLPAARPALGKQPASRVESAPHLPRGVAESSANRRGSGPIGPRPGFEATAPAAVDDPEVALDIDEKTPRRSSASEVPEPQDVPSPATTASTSAAVCPSPPRADPAPQARHRPDPSLTASVPVAATSPARPAAVRGDAKAEASPAVKQPPLSGTRPFRIPATVAAAWPAVSDADTAFLDGGAMEDRGGEYFYHFEKTGVYACRRCRTPVARADSKVRREGGYAAFAQYTAENLKCLMNVGPRSTQFQVRCAKCDAFVGLLTKESTSTGDCLRVNSRAIWFVPTDAATVLPSDGTFGAVSASSSDSESDDDFDDELDSAFK